MGIINKTTSLITKIGILYNIAKANKRKDVKLLIKNDLKLLVKKVEKLLIKTDLEK